MDVRQLSYFSCILEEGGVTAAARKLGLSQPALTKAICAMEKELQVKLFERGPNGMTPTVYGDLLYDRAKAILAELDRAQREIESRREASQEILQIGASPSFTSGILPRVLLEVTTRFPNTRFGIREGAAWALLRALRRRELDLCIVAALDVPEDSFFACEDLFEDEICVLASADHPLVRAGRASMQDLLDYPWAYSPGGVARAAAPLFLAAGLEMPQAQADLRGSAGMLATFLSGGRYLGLGPPHAFPAEIEKGQIAVVTVEGFRIPRRITAVTARAADTGRPCRAVLAATRRWASTLGAEPLRETLGSAALTPPP